MAAFAQHSSLDSQKLDEITVSDHRNNNLRSTDAGKLPVPARDLPMSISIVDQASLEQKGVLRLDEALQAVPGVYQMGASGGYQQEIAGRGYAFSSTNTFKNGVRFNNSVMPEVSSLEKLEVLKGSAAILYGNVAAGGILNLVTKKPQFNNGGEVGFRVGSYDFYKPYVDLYGAVAGSKHLAYRLNTSYEKGASFRDGVKSERIYVNPSLLFLAGKKTELLLEGDFLKDNRTLDYGTGAVNYVLADIPRGRFLGAAWSYVNQEEQSLTLTTTHHFNDRWQLRNITGIQDYHNELFGTTRPNASGNMVRPDGTWIRGIQRSGIQERYYVTQLDLTGHINTGSVAHTVLIGADYDAYNTVTSAYNVPSTYDTINIYDLGQHAQRTDIPAVSLKAITTAPINRYGMYVQDLISLNKYIKVLAGVRYSNQQTGSDVLTVATNTTASDKNQDGAFSPRFGLVYQPDKALSFFASYANSFVLNTGVDISGNALPPSFVNQYEAGAKTELFRHVLMANLSVYRIINSNLAQTSLQNGNTNTNVKELAGEVTSEGAELELQTRSWKGLSAVAAYSYNETKYTASNTYVVGSRLRYNPNHTANLGIFYSFSKASALRGLDAGINCYYVGNRVAGRSTRVQVTNDAYRLMEIPDYAVLDASIGYTYHQVSLRVKLSNVTNVLSYNIHDDNSVNPIAPRQFAATISYKF